MDSALLAAWAILACFGVIAILLFLLIRGWREEQRQADFCDECLYCREKDDFSPCWICENGSCYEERKMN